MINKKHIVHPEKVILEEFINPLGLTQKEAAKGLGISQSRLSELVNGKRQISAECALRLSLFFGMDEQTWLNLQNNYDRQILENTKANTIRKQVHPYTPCRP